MARPDERRTPATVFLFSAPGRELLTLTLWEPAAIGSVQRLQPGGTVELAIAGSRWTWRVGEITRADGRVVCADLHQITSTGEVEI